MLHPWQGRIIGPKAELCSHESRFAAVPSWGMGLLATVFLPAFFGVGVSMQTEPLIPSSAPELHRDKPEADLLLYDVVHSLCLKPQLSSAGGGCLTLLMRWEAQVPGLS